MTMRSTFHSTDTQVAIWPQTIINSGSPENLVSGGVDLQFFNSAKVIVILGDIDELGGSPVGAAQVEVILEDGDDNSTWTAVTLVDVVGPSSVTGGVVATTTTDIAAAGAGGALEVSYVGDKRYIRVTLQPTALTNGGPITAIVERGHPRHGPQ